MATLGSTTEPTSSQEWFGLNTTNQYAIKLTMPSGGPWLVTQVGAWFAGKDAVCSAKLCIWNSGMTLIGESATVNAASRSFGLGQNDKYQQDLLTPVEVSGGADVWVGISRDDDEAIQFGCRSGSRRQNRDETWPGNLSGYSTVSGTAEIGAYLVYESANQAPNAPTGLSPTGNEVVNSGTAPTLSGTRSDPDGDNMTSVEIEVYEDDGTTKVYDSGKVADGGTTFARVVSLPAAHAFYKWKARTWDSGDLAGPFSALQRFYANAVPATPNGPTVSSTSTLTPTFSGSMSDPGDSITHVQLQVVRTSDSVTMWDSGDIADSGSTYSQAYAGTALAWGVQYKVRVRVKDSHGAYSAWSSYTTWTTTQPPGPDNMSPTSTDPRQSSLTPTLTVGHLAAQFRNEQIQVRTTPGGGTLLWDKAKEGADYANTNSKARVYAGTALSYGQTYYWRALIELSTGVDTSWSDWYPFRINATPNAPTGMSPTGGVATSDTTPELRMNFSDPDTDQGDFGELVDVEVRDNADDSLDWSQTGATPTPSGSFDHVVSTGALTLEKTYKWRARFTDDMGLVGPWSAYQLFKVSASPTAALVAPSEAGVVTESTPTLDWTYSSTPGKAQYSYQIRVFDKGPTGANYADEVMVWDSGEVISADTARDVPFGVLVDGHDYRWEVTVKDTDLLTYTLA